MVYFGVSINTNKHINLIAIVYMNQLSHRSKLVLYVFVLCSLLLLMNLSSTSANNSLIIVLSDVEWPPSCHFGDNYTSFNMIITYNITNSGDIKHITTPHSNLLYPYMIVDIEGFYAEYEGTTGLCVITNHTIESGVTTISFGMRFDIPDYNSSIVPPGKITFWSDFASHSHPYNVVIYKTTLLIDNDGMIAEELIAHSNIDGLVLLGSLAFVIIVFQKKRHKF